MRAGRVVAGTVGIVRATVPFHGEHDAPEPTKEGLRFSTVRLPTPRCVRVSVNLFCLSLSRCDCCGCVCCFSGTPLFRRVSGAGAARAPAPGAGCQRPAAVRRVTVENTTGAGLTVQAGLSGQRASRPLRNCALRRRRLTSPTLRDLIYASVFSCPCSRQVDSSTRSPCSGAGNAALQALIDK